MKIRQAWKMWKNEDFSPRFPKAMRTIETRTRRYYRNSAKRALKQGKIMQYRYYSHAAESMYLMDDTLFNEDGKKVGQGYHVW